MMSCCSNKTASFLNKIPHSCWIHSFTPFVQDDHQHNQQLSQPTDQYTVHFYDEDSFFLLSFVAHPFLPVNIQPIYILLVPLRQLLLSKAFHFFRFSDHLSFHLIHWKIPQQCNFIECSHGHHMCHVRVITAIQKTARRASFFFILRFIDSTPFSLSLCTSEALNDCHDQVVCSFLLQFSLVFLLLFSTFILVRGNDKVNVPHISLQLAHHYQVRQTLLLVALVKKEQ